MKTIIQKFILSTVGMPVIYFSDAGVNRGMRNGELSIIPQPVKVKLNSGTFQTKKAVRHRLL